jgi:tRNA A-37 threonylcarbamoyl transferase component Bud32
MEENEAEQILQQPTKKFCLTSELYQQTTLRECDSFPWPALEYSDEKRPLASENIYPGLFESLDPNSNSKPEDKATGEDIHTFSTKSNISPSQNNEGYRKELPDKEVEKAKVKQYTKSKKEEEANIYNTIGECLFDESELPKAKNLDYNDSLQQIFKKYAEEAKRKTDKEAEARALGKRQAAPSTNNENAYKEKFMNMFSKSLPAVKKKPEGKALITESFYSRYDIKGKIGEGSNAIVKEILEKETGRRYALKSFKPKGNWPSAKNEAKILSELDHPNIIKYEKTIKTTNNVHLVMELVDGCNLTEYLRKNGPVSEEALKGIIKQILMGLDHCHDKGISHLDIKTENVLINEKKEIKLIDFAFSVKQIDCSKVRLYCGTPNYMAPEVLRKELFYGKKADVWAVGVVAYKLFTGKVPFKGKDPADILLKISNFALDKKALQSAHRNFRDFLQRLLRRNHEHRWHVKALLAHPWLLPQAL